MSSAKYISIAVIAAAAALVIARPHEHKAFELSDVANKTVCPINVVIDDNPNRTPRRIKVLKCADSPNKLCSENHMQTGCCKQHHHNYVTECVEIYDWIQVSFKDSEELSSIKIAVGCTCMIEETTPATEV